MAAYRPERMNSPLEEREVQLRGLQASFRAVDPPRFPRMVRHRRSRTLFLLLAAAMVVAGLASRRFPGAFPPFVAAYAGDVLWAAMVYLLIAAAWPGASTRRVAMAAGIVSLAVELGQLYHAPWIEAVRHTRLGGLVLGRGFLWSDLACYAAGIALAVLIDRLGTRPSAGLRRRAAA
jgi:hypothetical protein